MIFKILQFFKVLSCQRAPDSAPHREVSKVRWADPPGCTEEQIKIGSWMGFSRSYLNSGTSGPNTSEPLQHFRKKSFNNHLWTLGHLNQIVLWLFDWVFFVIAWSLLFFIFLQRRKSGDIKQSSFSTNLSMFRNSGCPLCKDFWTNPTSNLLILAACFLWLVVMKA